MYEKNLYELQDVEVVSDVAEGETLVEESAGQSDGLAELDAVDAGNSDVSVSDGDSGQAAESVRSGDTSSGDVSPGDFNTEYLGVDPVLSSGTVAVDVSEDLLQIQTLLDSINSTLFLIFIFLLLSWTEKKIITSVRKFTRERRF